MKVTFISPSYHSILFAITVFIINFYYLFSEYTEYIYCNIFGTGFCEKAVIIFPMITMVVVQ